MKVLLLAPYLWCPEIQDGDRNTSGLAHMVRSIAEEIGRCEDLTVFTQSYFVKSEKRVDTFNLGKKSKFDTLKSLMSPYLLMGLKFSKIEGGGIKRAAHVLHYFLGGAHVERYIKKHQIDVVSIHSIGAYTLPYLIACHRTNTPAVVTLHGLDSLDRNVTAASDAGAFLERLLMTESECNRLPITMIATGMKNRMKRELGYDLQSVSIVNNYCGRELENRALALRDCLRGSFSNGTKTILCVGSLTKLKNQAQTIRAVSILQSQIGMSLRVVLAGAGPELDYLKELSRELSVNAEFVGQASQEQLSRYYCESDVLVLASICEGFGLPVLEGYWHGLPAVMFEDLDAFDDLYSPDAMISVSARDDKALSEAINDALTRQWDAASIVEVAQSLSAESVGAKYVEALEAGGVVPSKAFVDNALAGEIVSVE